MTSGGFLEAPRYNEGRRGGTGGAPGQNGANGQNYDIAGGAGGAAGKAIDGLTLVKTIGSAGDRRGHR